MRPAILKLLLSLPLLIGISVRADEDTDRPIKEILESHWQAPAQKVKRLGSTAVTRAQKQKGDVATAQFCYGLLLAKNEIWDTAETTFKRVATENPDFVAAWLGMATSLIHQKKFDAAIASLKRAAEADAEYPQVAEFAGAFFTQLKEFPPEKLKRSKTQEAEDAIFKSLSPDQQVRFRKSAVAMRTYVKNLPELRAEKMKPVEKTIESAKKISEELTLKSKQRQNLLYEYESAIILAERSAQLAVASTAVANQVQSQAQSGNNPSAGYIASLNSRLDARAVIAANNIHVATAIRLRNHLEELDRDIGSLQKQVSALDRSSKEAMLKIENELKQPPLPFEPESERERILAGIGRSTDSADDEPAKPKVAAKPEKPVKPAEPDLREEKKARELFDLAESLRAIGKKDKARETFKRVVTLYPETTWAKKSNTILTELDEDNVEKP